MTNKTKKSEKLSAEQICKILHISKRKCSWMLQNGMIPCKDSGKKTRRYTVLRKDLDAYIKDSTAHPEKYFIPVTFTSNNPGKSDLSKKYEPDKYYIYPEHSARGSTTSGTTCPTSSPRGTWKPSSATNTNPSADGYPAAGSKSPKPITPSSSPANGSSTSLATTPSASSRKATPTANCWINTSVNAYHPSRAPLPKGFSFRFIISIFYDCLLKYQN